jgi:hypothetical protein
VHEEGLAVEAKPIKRLVSRVSRRLGLADEGDAAGGDEVTPSPNQSTTGPSRTALVEGLAREDDAAGGGEVTQKALLAT